MSALVSSMTSSSMASSSSSTLRRLMSFSLKAKSLRTPASSLETPLPLGGVGVGVVVVVASIAKRSGGLVREHREADLDRAQVEPVAVDQARPPLALAVDVDVGVAVELLEDEVAAVEEDLRVVLGHPAAADRHVATERPADGRDRLVDAVEARRARGGEILQRRHRPAA